MSLVKPGAKYVWEEHITNQAAGLAGGKGYKSIPYRAIWIGSLVESASSELRLVGDDGEDARMMGIGVLVNFTRVEIV